MSDHVVPGPHGAGEELTIRVHYAWVSYWRLKQFAWEAWQRHPWIGIGLNEFPSVVVKETRAGRLPPYYAAGIDPQGMVTFFRKLLEVRGSKPGSLEQFFSSHPLTEDRIRDAQARIDALPPKTLRADDPGFGDFQIRVASLAPEATPG